MEITMERSANSSDRDWKVEWEEEQTLTAEEERQADWDSREMFDDSWVEVDRRIVEEPLPWDD
jgi:hypothetical protein